MEATTKVQTNVVFDHLCESTKRFVVEQGGSRSGKSYNILIWIIFKYCMENTGKVISIVRKTQPSLNGTILRDFIKIMMDAGLYTEKNHNKTKNEYKFNGNLIEFFAVDDPQKIRGRRRDLCFCNEANELSYEDFFQLNLRTNDRMILDYNPSDVFHWIYDEVIPRKDPVTGELETDFFQTSYKDNPFLHPSLVKEIESQQYLDPNKWQVFGLGNRASIKDLVYQNWGVVPDIPTLAEFKGYGLDFGFSIDPAALVGVWEMNKELYVKLLIYELGLTGNDLVRRLNELGVSGLICCDRAEPKSIQELKDHGFKAMSTPGGNDNIRKGIDLLQSRRINIHEDSKDLLKEIQMYKWKMDINGNHLGKPVGGKDHSLDALRYWALVNLKRVNFGKYIIK